MAAKFAKQQVKAAGTKGGRKKKDDDDGVGGDGANVTTKPIIKHPVQLNLTEAELKAEITRVLTADNPHIPKNAVRYNFKKLEYIVVAMDQLAVNFVLEGNLVHKDSEEARKQKAQQDLTQDAEVQAEAPAESPAEPPAEAPKAEENSGLQSEGIEGQPETPGPEKVEVEEVVEERVETPIIPKSGPEKKLINQFNYNARASQTLNNPMIERESQTELPPRANFSDVVSQWEIYDAYMFELQQREKEKEKEKQKSSAAKKEEKQTQKVGQGDTQNDLNMISKVARIIERMVNQNAFDDIAQDFKYFEDAADELRELEGTLLPLWKFQYKEMKKVAVTALCWNPTYNDMFAVGLGSCEFGKQIPGMLLVYSLKNSSYPEYRYPSSVGVTCVDIHPVHCYLVAVGYSDGCVAVYNLKADAEDQPTYKSSIKNGKHTGPVWQVKWQKDDIDHNLNFYSVSSDSRIVSWTLKRNELFHLDIIRLFVQPSKPDGIGALPPPIAACGTALAFHKNMEEVFLVGTEEGAIHKCSKVYSSTFLDSYEGHYMGVNTLSWNPFHPNVFISCSNDWTIKMWDHMIRRPMLTFDLNNAVVDVAWSPYSSTVFAALTANCIAYVFDLSINKYQPLCQQSLAGKKKTKLTQVEFNPIYPILIVGDDRGGVLSLKLSPNLRKKPKEKKGQAVVKGPEVEIAKMEKILFSLRDP